MNKNRWLTQLAAYPYAQPLLIGWQIADYSMDLYWPEYEQALNIYLASQDEACSIGERYEWLNKSREQFRSLAAKGDSHIGTGLALVRLNAELGDRQAAMNAIENILQVMPWLAEPLPDELQIQINRPFLAPLLDFDNRLLQGDLGQWLQAAILEALEVLGRGE